MKMKLKMNKKIIGALLFGGMLVGGVVTLPLILTSCSKNNGDNDDKVRNIDGSDWKGVTSGTVTCDINPDGTTVTISGHSVDFAANNFVIPKQVTDGVETYDVTNIGHSAFQECISGTLSLPDTLISIGNSAFARCTSLTGDLVIPNSVTTVGAFVFGDCTSLIGTLTLSSSLSNISGDAFKYSFFSSLTNSVGELGTTGYYVHEFGGVRVLLDSDTYVGQALIGSIAFGTNLDLTTTTITNIDVSAFEECTGMRGSLTLPNSLQSIQNYAFNHCSSMTGMLTLSTNLTTIANNCFNGCCFSSIANSLGRLSATSPYYVCAVGSGSVHALFTSDTYTGQQVVSAIAFGNNLDLSALSITSINTRSFMGCSGITGTLTLPNTLTTIGSDAFYRCTRISGNLELKNTITAVGNDAFGGMTNIDQLTFTNFTSTPTWTGDRLFEIDNIWGTVTTSGGTLTATEALNWAITKGLPDTWTTS